MFSNDHPPSIIPLSCGRRGHPPTLRSCSISPPLRGHSFSPASVHNSGPAFLPPLSLLICPKFTPAQIGGSCLSFFFPPPSSPPLFFGPIPISRIFVVPSGATTPKHSVHFWLTCPCLWALPPFFLFTKLFFPDFPFPSPRGYFSLQCSAFFSNSFAWMRFLPYASAGQASFLFPPWRQLFS